MTTVRTFVSRFLAVAIVALLVSCGKPMPSARDADTAKSPAPSSYTLPAEGILKLTDLTNFAKLKRDYVKSDDFSKDFEDSGLFGRLFSVTLPVSSRSGKSESPVIWSYDADAQELSFTVVSGDLGGAEVPKLTLQEKTEVGAPKRMTNAFGAEILVAQMESWSVELGGTATDSVGVFVRPESDMGYDNLQWTVKLSPAQARALVAGLTLRAEGRIEKGTFGKTVDCWTESVPATIDSPTELHRHRCLIQAHFTRIALVGLDGKTVKEWRDNPSKPKAPPTPEDHMFGGEPLAGASPLVVDENGFPVSVNNSSANSD